MTHETWILTKIALILIAFVCPIAATMSFLISYEELLRHYPNQQSALFQALKTAAVTFVFFVFLVVVIFISLAWMLF